MLLWNFSAASFFVWTLPQMCGLMQSCLWAIQVVCLTSGLGFCSDMYFQLLDLLLRCVCLSTSYPFNLILKVVGSIPREHTYWQYKKCIARMHCKSLRIKASAKCIKNNNSQNKHQNQQKNGPVSTKWRFCRGHHSPWLESCRKWVLWTWTWRDSVWKNGL